MQRFILSAMAVLFMCMFFVITGVVCAQETTVGNLLANGSFKENMKGWKVNGKIEVKSIKDIPTLVVTNGMALQSIDVKPEWKYLHVQLRMRCKGVTVGSAIWKTGRLTITYYMADGKRINYWPDVPICSGTSGWGNFNKVYKIPQKTARVDIAAVNFGSSGSVEFQSIMIRPVSAAEAATLKKGDSLKVEASPNPVAKLPSKDQFHIFVLMGQSNMHGMAVIPSDYRKPNPKILSLQPNGEWEIALPPLDRWNAGGLSPGDTFATAYAQNDPGVTVGVIMVSQAGCKIEELSKGAMTHNDRAVYADAIALIKKASKQGTVKAVLWHQGEGNANDKKYGDKLRKFVSDLRKDTAMPDLPFIAGELGRFNNWTANFNKAFPDLLKSIPHTALVSSEGLGDGGDKVHFSTDAVKEFGKRYYEKYSELTGGK